MMEIDNKFISKLLYEAAENPRLRQNYDLRTSSDDNSQRMLNALLPGTMVPIHRHPNSTENVLLLHGKLVEVLYEEERPGDGIEQKHAVAWTRPPAVTAALSPLAPGTRARSWSRPSSMKPRTESTAKTGARRCEFWGGRGDCSGIYLYCVGICRLAHVGATIVLVDSQKVTISH